MSESLDSMVSMAEHFFNEPSVDFQPLPGWLIGALSTVANYQSRYILNNSQKKAYGWILDTVQPLQLPIQDLYRAQIGVLTSMSGYAKAGIREIKEKEVQTTELSQSGRQPLSEQRLRPESAYVGSGRVNAQGICVLYCATDVDTAILECRAPVGSAVT